MSASSLTLPWSAVLQEASTAKQIPVFRPDDQWGGSLCMLLPRGSSVGRFSDGPNRVPVALRSPAYTDGEVKDLIGK